MLRRLLRDGEAFFEKAGLFREPEKLEKYVIASEVTVEVLDLFLSRVLGTERGSIANGPGDLNKLCESLGCFSMSDAKGAPGEDLSARANEPEKAVEGLRVKVQDLERQLSAVQRQLQMQGEVSQLAASVDDRLKEVAQECERRISETEQAVSGDVRSQVAALSGDLRREVSERASAGDVTALSEEVSRLREAFGERILAVEQEAHEAVRVLRDEIQPKIKQLDAVTICFPDPLKGIIAYLTRECGGNVHENRVVEVTASSGRDKVKYAVELGTNSEFYTESKPNQWICYNFKGRSVAPTSYSIRTHSGSYFPKSWVFEVSNDGRDDSWQVVDRRTDNFDLKANHVTRNFAISDPPRGSFRFVRLRLTGKSHAEDDYLFLTSLEVFGTLSPQ